MVNKKYVNIHEASKELGMQDQYVSYYMGGIGGKPDLSKGLDVKKPDKGNYHTYQICNDDLHEFIDRIKLHRKESK